MERRGDSRRQVNVLACNYDQVRLRFESNAFFVIRVNLTVGDEVILWLNFARPRQPVPATGRIVWTSGGWGRPRYGIQWTHEGPQRSWIGWATRA